MQLFKKNSLTILVLLSLGLQGCGSGSGESELFPIGEGETGGGETGGGETGGGETGGGETGGGETGGGETGGGETGEPTEEELTSIELTTGINGGVLKILNFKKLINDELDNGFSCPPIPDTTDCYRNADHYLSTLGDMVTVANDNFDSNTKTLSWTKEVPILSLKSDLLEAYNATLDDILIPPTVNYELKTSLYENTVEFPFIFNEARLILDDVEIEEQSHINFFATSETNYKTSINKTGDMDMIGEHNTYSDTVKEISSVDQSTKTTSIYLSDLEGEYRDSTDSLNVEITYGTEDETRDIDISILDCSIVSTKISTSSITDSLLIANKTVAKEALIQDITLENCLAEPILNGEYNGYVLQRSTTNDVEIFLQKNTDSEDRVVIASMLSI